MFDQITALSIVFELGFFTVNHALVTLQLVPFCAFNASASKVAVNLAVVDCGAALVSVPESAWRANASHSVPNKI